MLDRLRPLFPYLKRYRRSFALGGAALVGYNVSKAFVPILVGGAIDDLRLHLGSATIARCRAHSFLASRSSQERVFI